ncbi:anthrax toxin-like adenylyl cyclase domain-containing protein [Salmonella enterica]
MPVSLPGFSSYSSFISLFLPLKNDHQEHWFDASQHNYIDLNDRCFDSQEADEDSVPFTEDSQRCMKQLIRQYAELKQVEIIYNGILAFFPQFPVDLINTAYSIYRALVQGKNIDMALLNSLGLASSCLLADGNAIAKLAKFLQETISRYIGVSYLSQFFGDDENPSAYWFYTALGVLAIAARYYWKNDNIAPNRTLLRVPAFLGSLLIQANIYWGQLSRMAQFAAESCYLPLQNEPGYLCVENEISGKQNNLVSGREAWSCTAKQRETPFTLKTEPLCGFTYSPEQLKQLRMEGVLFSQHAVTTPNAPEENEIPLTDQWEPPESSGAKKVESTPLMLPLTFAALEAQSVVTGNRWSTAAKIAGALGFSFLTSAAVTTYWFLRGSNSAEETEAFPGELTDQERDALEQQVMHELLSLPARRVSEPMSEHEWAELEEDTHNLEAFIHRGNASAITISATEIGNITHHRDKRSLKFASRKEYWQSIFNATSAEDPARTPLSLLMKGLPADETLVAPREILGTFPVLDGQYTFMDQINYSLFSNDFVQHLMGLAREVVQSVQVKLPRDSDLDAKQWLHLGLYYDWFYFNLIWRWEKALLRKDLPIASNFQRAVAQVDAIIARLEKNWGTESVHRGGAIHTFRALVIKLDAKQKTLEKAIEDNKKWLRSLQKINHKNSMAINATLSYTELRAEQNKLIEGLLKKNNLSHDPQQPASLVNNLIQYLVDPSIKKKAAKRVTTVSRLLLLPLGEYGSEEKDVIPYARRQAIIADWLNYHLLSGPFESWFIRQHVVNKCETHGQIRTSLMKTINDILKDKKGLPSFQEYYKDNVVKKVMPTAMLPLFEYDFAATEKMIVSEPSWGYLYVGAMVLSESGTALNGIDSEELEEVGVMMETLIHQEGVPQQYIEYFRLPALLHNALTNKVPVDDQLAGIEEWEMKEIYQNYFEYTRDWAEKNNPSNKFSQKMQQWKSRRQLAEEVLKNKGVSMDNVGLYLNSHEAKNWRGIYRNSIWLPNIDDVFRDQNNNLADLAMDVDKILLSKVFNDFEGHEKSFILEAKVELVKLRVYAEYVQDPGPPPDPLWTDTNANMYYIPRVVDFPGSIEFLRCTKNDEVRFFALKVLPDNGNYELECTEHRDEGIISFLDDNDRMLLLDYDKVEVRYDLLGVLKDATTKNNNLIDQLSNFHRINFVNGLYSTGYDKTVYDDFKEIALSFIPFYSCVDESIKGNALEASLACALDIVGLVPFIGQAARTGGRFGMALGKTASLVIRQGAQRATFKQLLQVGGQQIVRTFPSISSEVRQFGVSFLRSLDPGFELLAFGGIKGLKALSTFIAKTNAKGKGVARLGQTLAAHADRSFTLPGVSQLYSPGQGPGFGKELDVVPVGKMDEHVLWAPFHAESGTISGRKLVCNSVGQLEPAPIRLNQRLYLLQNEGLGGKGVLLAIKKWQDKARAAAGGRLNIDNMFRSPSQPLLYSKAFLRVAKKYNVIIGVRAPNRLGETLLKEGFPSKNFHVKAKSSSTGPTAGFIAIDPRYSKVHPSAHNKQERAILKAREAGANAVDLVLSKARIQELLDTDNMVFIGNEVYQAKYPIGEEIFVINAQGEVKDAAGLSVKVLTNPPNIGEVEVNNHKPITADYDLFAIIPTTSHSINTRYLELAPVLKNGKFELDFLKPKETYIKEKAKLPSGMNEDPNKGNVHYFGETIANSLNKEIAVEGYQGGKLVWHNDESGNPFSPGLDINDKPYFFTPMGSVLQITTLQDLKRFYSKVAELNFSPQYSPVFSWPSFVIQKNNNSAQQKIKNRLALVAEKENVTPFKYSGSTGYKIKKYGKEIDCIQIDEQYLPVRKHETRKFFEVYDRHNPERAGYPVTLGADDEWRFGFSQNLNANSLYITDELRRKITLNAFDVSIPKSSLSFPDSRGIVESAEGNLYLMVGDDYVRLQKVDQQKDVYTFNGGTMFFNEKRSKFDLLSKGAGESVH